MHHWIVAMNLKIHHNVQDSTSKKIQIFRSLANLHSLHQLSRSPLAGKIFYFPSHWHQFTPNNERDKQISLSTELWGSLELILMSEYDQTIKKLW